MTRTEALLVLNAIGLNHRQITKGIKVFGSGPKILRAGGEDLQKVFSAGLAEKISCFDRDTFLKSEYDLVRKEDVRVVTYPEEIYPFRLKHIPDAPFVLYIKGNLLPTDQTAVSIVGARRASMYGITQARRFARELASLSITIVSGLAKGIDAAAHHGALESGGRTIAVLGSGIGCIYPKENRCLAGEIAGNGAVISEFPMATEPMPFHFPRRNRIVSGLSLGTVVVEAARRSGALITARTALEQGRDVFAVPGRIDQPNTAGVHQLIKDGAKLILDTEDVLSELQTELQDILRTEKRQEPPVKQPRARHKILDFIHKEPIHIDTLRTKIEHVEDLDRLLLDLEFRKVIKRLPGSFFVLN